MCSVQAIRRKDFYGKCKSMNEKWLKAISREHGYYIAGFADGEGSFNVSVKKRKDYQNNWKLTASFNISQKDRTILAFIKKVMNCGTLRERKDGVVYFEVTNIASLKENVIPFFKKFRFLSARKKKNFSVFVQIVELMHNKEHLTQEGFKKVLLLREQLNDDIGRKRKYTLKNITRET